MKISSSGYIYVGYDGTGLYKVGISSSPKNRYKQIKTGNPTFCYLWVFEVRYPQVLEAEIHQFFSEKQVSGEWFSLSKQDLLNLGNKIIFAYVEKDKERFNNLSLDMEDFSCWDVCTKEKLANKEEHRTQNREWWIGKVFSK